MANGVLFRRDTKLNLSAFPPVVGEMIFALDTFEVGMLAENGTDIDWKLLYAPLTTADITEAANLNYVTDSNLIALGYIIVNGNINLDDVQTKLTGIEDNATADQTDLEIKTAYENNTDTNEYSDAEKVTVATVNNSGTTVARPASPVSGQTYFDTDLVKPIWYDAVGVQWVDATGTTV